MSELVLHVKREYFEQIESGEKLEEYRLATPYWSKRLDGRIYECVVIQLGYPKRGDGTRTLLFPWRGYECKTITHKHFGDKPVDVFAIKVEKWTP